MVSFTTEQTASVVLHYAWQEPIGPGHPPGSITVEWFADGTVTAHLDSVQVARRNVTGVVWLGEDSRTITGFDVEDSFVGGDPLSPFVRRSVENLVRRTVRRALRLARRVLRAHPGRRPS